MVLGSFPLLIDGLQVRDHEEGKRVDYNTYEAANLGLSVLNRDSQLCFECGYTSELSIVNGCRSAHHSMP